MHVFNEYTSFNKYKGRNELKEMNKFIRSQFLKDIPIINERSDENSYDVTHL